MKTMAWIWLGIGLVASHTALAAPTSKMLCKNKEQIQVAYPDKDHAILAVKGELILMKNVISGSGARYIGDGWQWWTKGDWGILAKLKKGEEYASDDGTDCYKAEKAGKQKNN